MGPITGNDAADPGMGLLQAFSVSLADAVKANAGDPVSADAATLADAPLGDGAKPARRAKQDSEDAKTQGASTDGQPVMVAVFVPQQVVVQPMAVISMGDDVTPVVKGDGPVVDVPNGGRSNLPGVQISRDGEPAPLATIDKNAALPLDATPYLGQAVARVTKVEGVQSAAVPAEKMPAVEMVLVPVEATMADVSGQHDVRPAMPAMEGRTVAGGAVPNVDLDKPAVADAAEPTIQEATRPSPPSVLPEALLGMMDRGPAAAPGAGTPVPATPQGDPVEKHLAAMQQIAVPVQTNAQAATVQPAQVPAVPVARTDLKGTGVTRVAAAAAGPVSKTPSVAGQAAKGKGKASAKDDGAAKHEKSVAALSDAPEVNEVPDALPVHAGLEHSQRDEAMGGPAVTNGNAPAVMDGRTSAGTAGIAIPPAAGALVSAHAEKTGVDVGADGAMTPAVVPQVLPGVSMAKLVQGIGQTEMRVGMRSAEFGSISIRTSTTPDRVSAQISLDHGDLARALATHIPEMQAKLAGTGQTSHVQIDLNGRGAQGGSNGSSESSREAHGANANAGDGREPRQQREQGAASARGYSVAQRFVPSAVSGATNESRGSVRLDVRA